MEELSLFDGDEYKYMFIEQQKQSLNDKFIIPPFSVFDTKQGYWQDRKDKWKNLGIKSELGRDTNLTFQMGMDYTKDKNSINYTTSIFDPVLCEICYKWFCVKEGNILDPFAGGSVRGIVANTLGYKYIGIDLNEEQIKANEINAEELHCDKKTLKWINDDSLNVDKYVSNGTADLIFTCPPYYDLEIYSDKPNDLSNMSFENFKKSYKEILKKCCNKLKNNRFAIVVIGDVRDKKGYYRNLVDITKEAMFEGGMQFYNDIILLQNIATASLRASGQFNASRKVVKIHQNVLVFYKGDINEIKKNYNEVSV